MRRLVIAALTALVTAGCFAAVPSTSGAWTASVANADVTGASLWYSCSAAFSALASSAVLEWNLTEAAATPTATDSGAAGNAGTYQGTHAVAATAGAGGCSRESTGTASFDGTGSWVSSAKLTPPTGFGSAFSLAGWVRTPAGYTGAGDVVMLCSQTSAATTCTGRDYRLYLTSTGAVVFATANTSSQVMAVKGPASASVTDGAWHHVAGTLSSAGMRLYVDGTDVTASSTATLNGSAASAAGFTSARTAANAFWHVGEGDGGTNWPEHDPSGAGVAVFLKGQLTGIGVYAAALTAQQVGSLAAAGR